MIGKKCTWCLTKVGHALTRNSSFACRKLMFREIKFNPNSLEIVLWRLRIHSQNNIIIIFRREKQKTTTENPPNNPGFLGQALLSLFHDRGIYLIPRITYLGCTCVAFIYLFIKEWKPHRFRLVAVLSWS